MNRSSDDEGIKCAICLDDVTNKAQPNTCIHNFCYECIKEWSQVKPECPLCKIRFRTIHHNFRSETDYDDFVVPPPPSRLPVHYHHGFHDLMMFQDDLDDELFEVEAFLNAPEPNFDFLFRERDPIRLSRGRRRERDFFLHRLLDSPPQPMVVFVPEDHSYGPSISNNPRFVPHPVQLPDLRNGVSDSNRTQPNESHAVRPTNRTYNLHLGLEIRQNIYNSNSWVNSMPTERHGVAFPSPEYFRSDPTVIARVTPWLRREVLALVGPHHSESQLSLVLNTILSIVYQYDMRSREFHDQAFQFFGPRTSHFQHEFYHFVVSGMRAEEYDFRSTYPSEASVRGSAISGFTSSTAQSSNPQSVSGLVTANGSSTCVDGSAMRDHDYATSVEAPANRQALNNDHDYYTSRIPTGRIVRSIEFLNGGELDTLRRAMGASGAAAAAAAGNLPRLIALGNMMHSPNIGVTGRTESSNEAEHNSPQGVSQGANPRTLCPSTSGNSHRVPDCECDRCTNSIDAHTPNSSSFGWGSSGGDRDPIFETMQQRSRSHRQYSNTGALHSSSLASSRGPLNHKVTASNMGGFPPIPPASNICGHHHLHRPCRPTMPHTYRIACPVPPGGIGFPVPGRDASSISTTYNYGECPHTSVGSRSHLRLHHASRFAEPSSPECAMSRFSHPPALPRTENETSGNVRGYSVLNPPCNASHLRRSHHVRIGNSPYGLHIDIFPTGIDATTPRTSTPIPANSTSTNNGNVHQPHINSRAVSGEQAVKPISVPGDRASPNTASRNQSSDEDDCQVVAVKCNSKKPPLDVITISSEDDEEEELSLITYPRSELAEGGRAKRFGHSNFKRNEKVSSVAEECSPSTSSGHGKSLCSWTKGNRDKNRSPCFKYVGRKRLRIENCLSSLGGGQASSSGHSCARAKYNPLKKEAQHMNNPQLNSCVLEHERALQRRLEQSEISKQEALYHEAFTNSNYDSGNDSTEGSSSGVRGASRIASLDFKGTDLSVMERNRGGATVRRSSVIRHTSIPRGSSSTSSIDRPNEAHRNCSDNHNIKSHSRSQNHRRMRSANIMSHFMRPETMRPSVFGYCDSSSSEDSEVEILSGDPVSTSREGRSGTEYKTADTLLPVNDGQNFQTISAEVGEGEEEPRETQILSRALDSNATQPNVNNSFNEFVVTSNENIPIFSPSEPHPGLSPVDTRCILSIEDSDDMFADQSEDDDF